MATNFTNKYMQVFQNYNEFGEHSADYVRGEDHIAFLIEENEVIYWLYLEQVWRPLNVRTTTTGQLEDGRTKVAVRLEYVEGGQKYTSVPNIPDPERITSMSHFLEDYPDIEEVNVSGTVNLTDLSYAFAGSKIKDFSMLDTSNVDNIYGFINNISNNDLIIKFSTNKTLDDFKISDVDINKLTITANRKNDNSLWSFIDFNCDELELISNKEQYSKITVSGSSIDTIKNENGQVTLQYSADGGYNNFINNVYAFITRINCDSIIAESININGDTCILYENSRDTYNFKYKAFVNVNNLIIGTGSNYQMYIQFGSGIKYNEDVNIDINIANNRYIPSFIFTTPIVDDAFYAKYAQYNCPISIFQYKTTFTEVADVNISNITDSNLIYIPYNINDSNINFDVSSLNIEIYNKVNINFSSNEQLKYNRFIIDNTNLNLAEDNLPIIKNKTNIYDSDIDFDRIIATEECRISGKYDCKNNGIADMGAFKDITFYNCPEFRIAYELVDRNINFNDCINIYINNYKNGPNFNPIKLLDKEDTNIINSILTASSTYYGVDNIPYFIIDYLENKQVNIDFTSNNVSYLCWFLNYYEYTSSDKPIIIKKTCVLCYRTFNVRNTDNKESVYIDCKEDGVLILGFNVNNYNPHVSNIYGNVILRLEYTEWNNNSIVEDAKINHIDIKEVILTETSTRYEMFNIALDEESTINLVAKLIDNTSSSTRTIYMYRSQSNIIGEENIAAAVAKNYEFAIIEN